jgi:diadenosine tetraphosphate (Ap4A) HIT family hydrolase
MSELPDCQYCRKDQRLHDLMIEIGPMKVSTLYLFKEQTYRGRCVVAYRDHVNELFELSDSERDLFMQDVACAAKAMQAPWNGLPSVHRQWGPAREGVQVQTWPWQRMS